MFIPLVNPKESLGFPTYCWVRVKQLTMGKSLRLNHIVCAFLLVTLAFVFSDFWQIFLSLKPTPYPLLPSIGWHFVCHASDRGGTMRSTIRKLTRLLCISVWIPLLLEKHYLLSCFVIFGRWISILPAAVLALIFFNGFTQFLRFRFCFFHAFTNGQ